METALHHIESFFSWLLPDPLSALLFVIGWLFLALAVGMFVGKMMRQQERVLIYGGDMYRRTGVPRHNKPGTDQVSQPASPLN